MFSVLNRFFGTAADTRHAVGTLLPPHRFSALYANVVKRTHSGAPAAGNAAVGRIKLFGVDNQRIKNIVSQTAVEPVFNRNIVFGEIFAGLDAGNRPVNHRLCPIDDLLGLLRGRRSKKRDVIFRHNNTHAAAAVQILFLAQLYQIFFGISDAVPAG